ncbi:flagellar assembly protein A [Clostridium sp. LBM24168]
MKKVFHGSSLENCINDALSQLNIKKEELKYTVLENKRGFFKKKVIIEVEIDEAIANSKSSEDMSETTSENNGTVKVEGGNIIVKDPKDGGSPAVIRKGENMTLVVDGTEIKNQAEVFVGNKIEVVFEENEPQRQLNIYTSDDKMEAYAEVIYSPRIIYGLKDEKEREKLTLHSNIVQKTDPPKYTQKDVKEELSKNNIIYGIIEENLKEVIEGGNKRIVIAQGKKAVDGEDDYIETKFEVSSSFKEDKVGNVDFKSIGLVNAMKKGEVVAVCHSGKKGENGSDITGKTIKCKNGNKISIKAGAGCSMKDDCTVVAAIDGKPSRKGNVFYVYQVHELNNDVDLKTGNICFMGDITVHGSIKEGMGIECGNNLVIDKDVERSVLSARGNIVVRGSIVASKICGGGEDVKKIKSLEHLKDFSNNMRDLVTAVNEIKMYNLFGQEKKDGEIIKILLENKFKNVVRLCINLISDLNFQSESENHEEDDLVRLIRSKLMGIAPVNIESCTELNEIADCADSKIEELKNTLKLPVKVVIAYCQDSSIESSGDVIITSRGEYISNITANGSIEFLKERSVARGGYLKAKNEIKCRIVGSVAGVTTRIEVEDQGNIWADIAYHNTVFKVGVRELVLDSPSKNVHAYLKDGNIVVDKFVL